jgi:hypothetical protein
MHRDRLYRDPETGQFLAVDDDQPVELNYSDHEFLNLRIVASNTDEQDANNGTEYQVESDVLDLENDELAMLSWLNASLSLVFEGFDEDVGAVTRGGAFANVEIGANLSSEEFLSQAETNAGVEETDSEQNVSSFALRATDEPGLWAHLNATASSGYKDSDADGTFSGNSSVDNDRMRRVFREETAGGPYIDATDDVNIGLYVDKQDATSNFRSVIYAQMAFVIFEYENRRAEFAPYDPGTGG